MQEQGILSGNQFSLLQHDVVLSGTTNAHAVAHAALDCPFMGQRNAACHSAAPQPKQATAQRPSNNSFANNTPADPNAQHRSPETPTEVNSQSSERIVASLPCASSFVGVQQSVALASLDCNNLERPGLLLLPAFVNSTSIQCLIDSGASHSFVDADLVAKLQLKQQSGSELLVQLADGRKVSSATFIELPLLWRDQNGQQVSGTPSKWVVRVLKDLTSEVVLGMDWLSAVNPAIDWVAMQLQFANGQRVDGSSVSNSQRAKVELCSVHQLQHTMRRDKTPAWFALLRVQQSASLAAMEATEPTNSAEVAPLHTDKWKLVCQEFSDVFEAPCTPPAREITHSIDLVSQSEPPKPRIYRMSPAELAEVRRQLDEYLDKGWIRPSTSPYGAPILFARKKDGTLRMCIDYRALNQRTVKDRYPLPRIDDLLDRLTSATIFSKLDLSQGYHQVRITPGHEFKTAFISRFGLYEFVVMPFGLCNAPSTFQRLMHHTLGDLLDNFVLVYLDDILIYSSSVVEHEQHLRTVLQRLRDHKLYCKLKKCEFGLGEIEYLGHLVGGGKLRVDPAKVAAVQEWETPSCVKHVQQFLGFANYYNRYIARFATLAAPLSDLLRKGITWHWGPQQQAAFDQLKQLLVTTPVLQLADPYADFTMYTDASDIGVGAVLMQDIGSGEHPIAYFSRKLSPTERNYSVPDRELYAVYLATQRWRCYLHGRTTVVYTDHKPLESIHTQPSLNSRQVRWLEKMGELDLKIVHTPGRDNAAADALSRQVSPAAAELYSVSEPHVALLLQAWLAVVAPHATLQACITAATQALLAHRALASIRCSSCSALHLDEGSFATRKHIVHICNVCGGKFRIAPAVQGNPLAVLGCQLQGSALYLARLPNLQDYPHQHSIPTQDGTLTSIVLEPSWLSRVSEAQHDTSDREMTRLLDRARSHDPMFAIRHVHGVDLMYRVPDHHPEQLVIPTGGGFRQLLLEELHCTSAAGHLASRKTLFALQQRVWWPGMARQVHAFVRGCSVCQAQKDSTQPPAGLLQPLETPPERFHTWSMDFITDLPPCHGYNAVFTCVDKLTKFVRLIPCFVGEGHLDAAAVATLFFDSVVRLFGMPSAVLHDRDPRFTSQFWRCLWDKFGSRVLLSSAFHPQTDGQTERSHRTIEQVIRCLLAGQQLPESTWCAQLAWVELAINSAVQSSTGKAPAELVFGQSLRMPVDHLLQSGYRAPAAVDLAAHIIRLVESAKEQLTRAQQYQATYANRHRVDRTFIVGQSVLLDSRHLHLGSNKKFRSRFVGPFRVTGRIGPVAYRLDLGGRLRRIHPVFHVSLLRQYHTGGDGHRVPVPIEQDGSEEFEVERLLQHRQTRSGHLEYLVRWKGFDASFDLWLPEPELFLASELLSAYKAEHGL